jgi:steroid 5-alpha reductase family enzyme
MIERQLYAILLIAMFVAAAIVFVVLLFIAAPYGRHTRRGWGPRVNSRLGWVIMESPAVIVFALCFALGGRTASTIPIAFLALWQTHYIHRSYVFPFRMRWDRKHMTLLVMSIGFIFNAANAYLNGRYINTIGPGYPSGWMMDPRFIIGVLLFFTGFAINLHSDSVLRGLRMPGETGYKIPHGGLFELVSCANYFGEILEWCGWAVATWSLPGLAFAVWTAANLVPRARAHHHWYPSQFPDYPPQRRALIPFLF